MTPAGGSLMDGTEVALMRRKLLVIQLVDKGPTLFIHRLQYDNELEGGYHGAAAGTGQRGILKVGHSNCPGKWLDGGDATGGQVITTGCGVGAAQD